MCGISGFFNLLHSVPLAGYYETHLRLRHRGQDDEGFLVVHQGDAVLCRGDDTITTLSMLPHVQDARAANVVLGHRRLAILDLSEGGHQPIYDRSGRFSMVYNGEIYNYIELRQELTQRGHVFGTQSDAEVLLAVFSEWGPGGFRRLNGMWALAIYDLQEQRLILCRDRFGVKPLYYALVGGTLYFGSEAKFLLPFLSQLHMNQPRVREYLRRNLVDHHPETMFAGVQQLMPAHYMVVDAKGTSHENYWHLPEVRAPRSMEEAIDQLQALLTSAVSLRLRSDVPIGSLLSGGLDSTTIVCILRQLLDQQGATNSFDLFSAIFPEEEYSEKRYIEETVAQVGMPVHWIHPAPAQLPEALPHLLYHQEFPFRSLSVYSQWEIMRQVHQTPIVVLLNGQGSDEIFGGYTAHHYALVAEYLRRLRPRLALREAQALARIRDISVMQSLAAGLRQLAKAVLLTRSAQENQIDRLAPTTGPSGGLPILRDLFRAALVRNLTYSALPEYLRYEDRNTMAFTLESRLPFLDYRLVEWAMSLPADLKIESGVSKRLLREMARPMIPSVVAARTDKMGFVSPQEKWQRETLAPLLDAAFDRAPMIFGFLDGDQIRRRYREYQAGSNDDWPWVWRVACLTWWYQCWWEA